MTRWQRRQLTDYIAKALGVAATAFGLFWLAWILWTTVSKGLPALKWDLITQMTPPPGADGGLLNAFVGSAVMCALAVLIGTPIGIGAGTYLSEYARHTKLGAAASAIVSHFVFIIVIDESSVQGAGSSTGSRASRA